MSRRWNTETVAATLAAYDAAGPAERRELLAQLGIRPNALANLRRRYGMSPPLLCPCGVDLPVNPGRRRLRCDTCEKRFQRLRSVARLYGISAVEFEAMETRFNGACWVCGELPKPTDKLRARRSLHVDHDHDTGTVRGLLCHGCNLAIGYAREDPARLRALATYVAG